VRAAERIHDPALVLATVDSVGLVVFACRSRQLLRLVRAKVCLPHLISPSTSHADCLRHERDTAAAEVTVTIAAMARMVLRNCMLKEALLPMRWLIVVIG
jgi:hypothetical protein